MDAWLEIAELKEKIGKQDNVLSQIIPQANFIIEHSDVPYIRGAARVILFLVNRIEGEASIKVCRWIRKEGLDNEFDTECGNSFNTHLAGFPLCPYCGGEIKYEN